MTEEMMLDDLDFSGSQGATVAKESNKGGDFQREVDFLKLDASEAGIRQGKDTAVVRLVTEYEQKPYMQGQKPTAWTLAWITVGGHYAPTKHKPPYAREDGNWPEKMGAGCRKDKVFSKRFNGQCYICDTIGQKPSDRTWALGIEREEVRDESGRLVGLRDKTREVTVTGPDGKFVVTGQENGKDVYAKKVVPAWVILNFGWRNFFGPLAGIASYRGTVLDRDYVVKRTGTTNNDTSYSFIPLDPIHLGSDNPWGVAEGPYDMGRVVGQQDGRQVTLAERLYPEMPDLRRIIAERVSEDYFGRWFLPGWLPEGFDPNAKGNSGGGQVQNGVQTGYVATTSPQQPAAPVTPAPAQAGSAEPSASALDALKARVTAGTGQFTGTPSGQ